MKSKAPLTYMSQKLLFLLGGIPSENLVLTEYFTVQVLCSQGRLIPGAGSLETKLFSVPW
jgi:hypothetical protein